MRGSTWTATTMPQLFHTAANTGGNTAGWVLTSLIVVSEDSQGDDFDVDICEAHNSTEFPTSTCTELLPPDSFTAGSLEFTAGIGMLLSANTNYTAVFKQVGNEGVSLDATASAGEDSTGLSGWSIKNKFDWNDGGTWKQKGGSSNEAILITVNGYETVNLDATGRPIVLASAEGAGILAADTSRIADANGIPYTGSPGDFVDYVYSYQWIRVDGMAETNVGADSASYQPVDADTGKLIKVRVSFTDRHNFSESVTSLPFGPVAEQGPSRPPTTLVSNTGQSPSATANITQQYAMGFQLGAHGQGYEISSVSIDLAAAPSSLSVSLWTGGPPGSPYADTRSAKLFEFENPASFQAGLNEFTAPAGVYAYHNLDHWIVLSGFGSSLSITETTSDDEDAGETGATLDNDAGGDSGVLRLAVNGSRRTTGILAANFTYPGGRQEIISVGDKVGWGIDVGAADRYLIRGLTLNGDNTSIRDGGFDNPFSFRSDSLSGAKHFNLFQTRNVNGLPVWTAPQGATVAGSNTYVFDWQFNEERQNGDDTVDRIGAVLTRVQQVHADNDGKSDHPPAPGVSLGVGESVADTDAAGPTAYMAVHGVPLYAMVQNLGQTDDDYRHRRQHLRQGVDAGLHDRSRRGQLRAAGHRRQHRGLRQQCSRRFGVRVGGRTRRFGRETGREAVRPPQPHRIRGRPQLLRGAAGNDAGGEHLVRDGVEPPRRRPAQAAEDRQRWRGLGRADGLQHGERVLSGRRP